MASAGVARVAHAAQPSQFALLVRVGVAVARRRVAARRRGHHFFPEGGVDEIRYAASRAQNSAAAGNGRRRAGCRPSDGAHTCLIGQTDWNLFVARIGRILLGCKHVQKTAAATAAGDAAAAAAAPASVAVGAFGRHRIGGCQ